MANVASVPSRIAQCSPNTPRLHIQALSDDIADDEIVCSCSRGRPPTGHNVVLCRECDKWHHMPCQVGENTLPGAAALKGYQCRGCKTLRRSNSGKIAREKRRVVGNDVPGSAKSTKRGPSSSSTPTVANTRNNHKLNSWQPISEVRPKQITQGSSPEVDDDEASSTGASVDEIAFAPMQDSGADELISGRKKPIREIFLEVQKKFDDALDQALCECVSHPLEQEAYVVRCLDCETLHAEDCMISLEQDPIGKGSLCTKCSHRRTVQDAAWKKYIMLKAVSVLP